MENIITHAQLVRTGLSDNDIAHRLRARKLTRIRRGVYTATRTDSRRDHHRIGIEAAMQAVDPTCVVAYESAAVLHGLPLPSPPDQVTMIRRSSGHADAGPDLRMRDTFILSNEVTMIGHIPVTTLERTVMDLARRLPPEWGLAVCDAALALGLPRHDLLAAIGRHRRLRGLPRARSIAALAEPGAESPAESISRFHFVQQGIPAPLLQFEVVDADGVVVARTDFGWPDFGLVGEVDGKWKYGELLRPGQDPAEAIMREKHRENLIRAAGFWILRWDWSTANDGPTLAARVWAELERHGHPLPRRSR